jgi:uncharacterized protein
MDRSIGRLERGMRFLVVIVAAAVIGVGLMWVFQRRMVYFPATDQPAPPVGVEEVSYETDDGLDLSGWFLPVGESLATVVVFPGNAGHREARLPLARALSDRGVATLLVDYRGYGGNPGSPTEAGLAADARAAVAYAAGRPDVDSDRLVYFGESLGAGVAVTLAVTHPPSALVLRSPFTSLVDVGAHHYPWLPISALARDRYPNLETIDQISTPVLVVAGSADRIVPPAQSRRLYDAVPGKKRLLVIDGAGHNDFALLAGGELIDTVVAFVEEELGSGER